MHYITVDMMGREICEEFKTFFYKTFGDKGMEVSEEGFSEVAAPHGTNAGWMLGGEWFRMMLETEELIEEWDKEAADTGSYVSAFIKLYPGKRKQSFIDKIVKDAYK